MTMVSQKKEENIMRRMFWIYLFVFGLIVSWTLVCAADFYVIPTKKKNYAPVEKTGQTTSCAAGDDGALKKGVAWPSPRFTDNADGTVSDNLTGLIWLKQANYNNSTFGGANSSLFPLQLERLATMKAEICNRFAHYQIENGVYDPLRQIIGLA